MNAIKYPRIDSKPISGDDMIVTEKIHGSNIGIGYVNGLLRIQSRNQIIGENNKHFGLSKIIDPLKRIIQKMKDIIECDFLVYGEIFGHMKEIKYDDSETSKNAFQSDSVFYRAFDIYYVNKRLFLNYNKAIEIFEQVGLPYLPILNIVYKTIDDLKFIVETYKSAYSEDFVEGFVLKKDTPKRNIFKVKRKKYNERPSLNKFPFKDYINNNRYSSAYSKIGDGDIEKIKQEMIQDSLKDIISVIKENLKIEVENYFVKKFNKKSKLKTIL